MEETKLFEKEELVNSSLEQKNEKFEKERMITNDSKRNLNESIEENRIKEIVRPSLSIRDFPGKNDSMKNFTKDKDRNSQRTENEKKLNNEKKSKINEINDENQEEEKDGQKSQSIYEKSDKLNIQTKSNIEIKDEPKNEIKDEPKIKIKDKPKIEINQKANKDYFGKDIIDMKRRDRNNESLNEFTNSDFKLNVSNLSAKDNEKVSNLDDRLYENLVEINKNIGNICNFEFTENAEKNEKKEDKISKYLKNQYYRNYFFFVKTIINKSK